MNAIFNTTSNRLSKYNFTTSVGYFVNFLNKFVDISPNNCIKYPGFGIKYIIYNIRIGYLK
jgi:hypothetical protein